MNVKSSADLIFKESGQVKKLLMEMDELGYSEKDVHHILKTKGWSRIDRILKKQIKKKAGLDPDKLYVFSRHDRYKGHLGGPFETMQEAQAFKSECKEPCYISTLAQFNRNAYQSYTSPHRRTKDFERSHPMSTEKEKRLKRILQELNELYAEIEQENKVQN